MMKSADIQLPGIYVEMSAKEDIPELVDLPKEDFGDEILQVEVCLRQTQTSRLIEMVS